MKRVFVCFNHAATLNRIILLQAIIKNFVVQESSHFHLGKRKDGIFSPDYNHVDLPRPVEVG